MASSENGEEPTQTFDETNKLLSAYERIRYSNVEQKVAELRQITAQMQGMWNDEVKQYEQLMEVKIKGKGKIHNVPRRNYYNSRGEVSDPTMFPYHTACYPLLDCYDCLYEDRDFQPTYEKHAVIPPRVRVGNRREEPDDDEQEADVPGALQTSWSSIHAALLYAGESWDESDLANNAVGISEPEIYAMCNSNTVRLDLNPSLDDVERRFREQNDDHESFENHGPHNLPLDEKERQLILLKLFRHAMSDLQRDHRLAYAVLRRMIDWCYFNDVTFYARFLSIIMVEQRKCDGECHSRYLNATTEVDEPDHYCVDWQQIELVLSKLVPLGLAHFTEDHALFTCAAMKMAFDTANSAACSIEHSLVRGDGSAQILSRDPKTTLKQSLYLWNNTAEDEDSGDEDDDAFRTDPMPYTLMNEFLVGLGRRAVQSRDHIVTLTTSSTGEEVQEHKARAIRILLDSFYNCVRTIVFCAEMSVRRLPSNARSMDMGGTLVRCLVEAYLEPRADALDDQEEYMPRWRIEELKGKSLIDFTRYSDLVNKAANVVKIENESSESDYTISVNHFLTKAAPDDVRDVIRSLFARDLVDIYTSLCGFGDVMVWLQWESRLPCDPLDPVLFVHQYNYTANYDDEEPYLFDEDTKPLCAADNRLCARYDFTLLLLQQAWNHHWTPQRHHTFQKPFREAAKSLFLSSHRIGMPLEIARKVIEYLPRTWWPDKEAKCWCQQCLVESSIQLMRSKLASEAESNGWTWKHPLVTVRCPDCPIASWVSHDHRKRDYRAHLCDCGKPPFKTFDFDDQLLCQDVGRATAREDLILNTSVTLCAANALTQPSFIDSVPESSRSAGSENYVDTNNGNDDDDGSWESVEEGDDEPDQQEKSATDIIFKYFNERFYKLRPSED